MEKKSVFSHFNWVIFTSMVLLLIFGAMMILSTILEEGVRPFENEVFVSHLLNITIGLILFILFSQLDYRLFSHLFIPLFIVTVFVLALVPITGYVSHGSARWFDLGVFTFQPSEFAKLFFILVMGAFLVKFQSKLPRLFYFLISIIITLILSGLIFIQPDLGTSLVLVVIWFGMYYIAGMKIEELLLIIFSVGLFIPFGWNFLKDYQKERLLVFINPQKDPLGSGYSVLQSIIAVGSGKLWGLGWGRGMQSRLQFLPERQTDFIFATLSEELGFIGVLLLVTLFIILFFGL
ncbi:MAG: FtsW/RodA/SpoVE family cell cycle protein, partial [Candidatus Heimdallarchaeota archaeon]